MIIVSVHFSVNAIAQINFHRIYTGGDYDFGFDVIQVEDSSYYLCGSSSSLEDAPSQALLMKVDSLGNYIWTLGYGSQGSDAFLAMDRVPNQGFLLGGYTNENATKGFDNYLVKVDLNGNVLWDTLYGGNNWERIVDVEVLEDSSFFVLSATNSFGSGGVDWWLQYFSSEHILEWENYYGGSLDDTPTRLLHYNDTLYVSGAIKDDQTGLSHGVLKKVAVNGVEIWETTLENNLIGNSSIDGLQVSHDLILISGGVYDTDVEESDLVLGLVNINTGNPTTYLTDFDGYQLGNAMALSADSNFVYVNVQSANSPQIANSPDGSRDSFIYKYTYAFGFANFSFTYSKSEEDFTGNMITTIDGGVVMVGYQGFYSNGKSSVSLVKMGSDESLPPLDQPIIDGTLILQEILDDKSLSLFPNPAVNILNITGAGNFEVYLFNELGQALTLKSLSNGVYDVSNLTPGVYFISIKDKNNYIRTLKFFKN